MSRTSNARRFLLLLFFSMFQNFGSTENCDFVKCTNQVKKFMIELRSSSSKFSCENLYNITSPWCSKYCLQKFFPASLSHSSKISHEAIDYCEKHLSQYSNVHWSCIAKHSFRLLTCFANITRLRTNDSHGNMLKESCRKSLEYQNCASEVLLSDCGLEAVKVVEDLFGFVTNYFQIPSCTETGKAEVYSMPVIYHLGKEYMSAAECYDKDPSVADTCFVQLIQDEKDLYGYLCGDSSDEVNECIRFQFNKYSHGTCKSTSNSSHKLLPKLLALGSVKCRPNLTPLLINPHPTKDFKVESTNQEEYSGHILDNQDDVDEEDFKTSTKTSVPSIFIADFSHGASDKFNKEFTNMVKVKSASNKKNASAISPLKTADSDVHNFRPSCGSVLNCDKIYFIILSFSVTWLNFIIIQY